MVGYILGLGDRHPSNLMLDRFSGIRVDRGGDPLSYYHNRVNVFGLPHLPLSVRRV